MIIEYEIWNDNCTLVRCLYERLNVLKNHIGNYILIIHRGKGDNVNFDLGLVSRVKFAEDGIEVILSDSSTAYLFYWDIFEFGLVFKETLNNGSDGDVEG